MTTSFRNLYKHFKKKYQTKTNREMSQQDFQFFENLMTFFINKKKVIEFFVFIFIFHICAKFQTKKKRLVVTSVFECFPITLLNFEGII